MKFNRFFPTFYIIHICENESRLTFPNISLTDRPDGDSIADFSGDFSAVDVAAGLLLVDAIIEPDKRLLPALLMLARGSLSSSLVVLTRQERPDLGLMSSGSAGDFRPPGSRARGEL